MRFNARSNALKKETEFYPQFGSDEIKINNKYLTRNGKPWVPLMGECHYSRVPLDRWEETLKRMKEGGIEIVSSYAIWIHHEEEKGCFDFSGNRDVRGFIELCHKLGLEFCLRIGPWSHGEVRNGGFPDWLVEECRSSLRTDNEPYFSYAQNYLRVVAEQVKGLRLFGIQIENEMVRRPVYMQKLYQTVVDAGLTPALYTATACGRAELPDTLLPLFGGYPDSPWAKHTNELEPKSDFLFSKYRNSNDIGSDLLGTSECSVEELAEYKFPFMLCELGAGNQNTYRRRALLSALDIEALCLCKLGSGANLLGYYMYAGGLNPIGKTTMQESRYGSRRGNHPVISYDFQAPIGDMGQLRESYLRLKYIHTFLQSFGEIFAPTDCVLPAQMPTSSNDRETLRCALRTDGKGGFLFVNNHLRLQHRMPAHPGHEFVFEFDDERVAFTLDVPSDSAFFLPVNLELAGLGVRYVTAQPLSHAENVLTLKEISGIAPQLCLKDGRAFMLRVGENRIDGTTVILLSDKVYEPTKLVKTSVEQASKQQCDTSILLEHLPVEDHTAEYVVRWSEQDKWLVIKAKGDLGGFFVEGKLISDAYLCGDAWVIDLRHLLAKEGRIKIQPLLEESREKIYFEIPFETGAHTPEAWVCRDDVLWI